jgi:catechol-2,3-dioxygenase
MALVAWLQTPNYPEAAGVLLVLEISNRKGSRRRSMSNPTLHHVTLKTTRLKEMIDWYGAVVGLEPQYVATLGAWLTTTLLPSPCVARLSRHLRRRRQGQPHRHPSHGFEFSSLDELFGNFARLRTSGIAPAVCLDHGMTISMYYADPDRNAVELQVDNFLDWAKSSEYMRTAREFAANPLGVALTTHLRRARPTRNCIAR